MFGLFAQHRMLLALMKSADRIPITSSGSRRAIPVGLFDLRSDRFVTSQTSSTNIWPTVKGGVLSPC